MNPVRSIFLALILSLGPLSALAQGTDPAGQPADLLAPPGSPGKGDQINLPDLGVLKDPLSFAPAEAGSSNFVEPKFDVSLRAQMTADGPAIANGLSWRVFSVEPEASGELALVATASGGTARLALPKGEYLVHGAYGRAGGTKRLKVTNNALSEVFILNAGGLRLGAVVGDDRVIESNQITFEISQEDTYGGQMIVLPDAQPDKIVRLSAGTYQIISRYGFVNAVVRAEIEVNAGKLTEATIRHKGAEATFKLVENEGGEALANTSWTVLTKGGDTVHQSVGAFPKIVLAEGAYTAVARHKEQTFARDFKIRPGLNRDVEVRLSDVLVQSKTDRR